MVASNTYGVIYLGTVADLDPTEGNPVAENANTILNTTFGSSVDPLWSHVGTMSPVGSPGDYYRTNNNSFTDQFTIDGGSAQTFDSISQYTATLTYTDGTTYDGSFVDGLRHGKGRLIAPDGFRYEGGWKNGEIDGEGVATYANGDVYTGHFVMGKRQGDGVMRYATGQVAAGEWQDNRLAVPAPDSAVVEGEGAEVAVPAEPSEAP